MLDEHYFSKCYELTWATDTARQFITILKKVTPSECVCQINLRLTCGGDDPLTSFLSWQDHLLLSTREDGVSTEAEEWNSFILTLISCYSDYMAWITLFHMYVQEAWLVTERHSFVLFQILTSILITWH